MMYIGLFLSSCSNVPPYSKGYDYDIELDSVEIAYYLEKGEFSYGEDIKAHISYGHDRVVDNIPDGKKNLPFCLYLDYGNDDWDESDYRTFSGYRLLEEVEPDSFYTDEYLYSQERYGNKEFGYTGSFFLPFSLFEENALPMSEATRFTFIACRCIKRKTDQSRHIRRPSSR